MKSKIAIAFENCRKEDRPAFITYTVAGDNTKKKSLEILKSISKYAKPKPKPYWSRGVGEEHDRTYFSVHFNLDNLSLIHI